MKIRLATIKDKAAIVRLYNLFVQGANHYKTDKDHNLATVLAEPNSHILVAEVDDKLVGFIAFSTRFVIRYPKPILQVEELFVIQEYRRQGIAAQFLEEVETFAKKHSVQAIYIESRLDLLSAHKFYEACDYKKDGYYFKRTV